MPSAPQDPKSLPRWPPGPTARLRPHTQSRPTFRHVLVTSLLLLSPSLSPVRLSASCHSGCSGRKGRTRKSDDAAIQAENETQLRHLPQNALRESHGRRMHDRKCSVYDPRGRLEGHEPSSGLAGCAQEGMQNGTTTLESGQCAIMLKTHLPDDPAALLLGIYSREMKTYFQTQTCMQAIITSLFRIAPKWEIIQHFS